ncbi:MAG TPA: DNA topoisomerase IB [Candidatus Limnocylindria bacterium]|nr:DNA topoisomerase IB [Candidatus Limnocylindria bacterium]
MPSAIIQDEAVSAARAAGLRYVNEDDAGIARRRAGRGFSYRAPDGSLVRDPAKLKRIRSLAIPPAWTEVWISPSERGHIQATGRDARGRKQYRYHPLWSEARDGAKFERTIAFAEALPRLRRQVEQDLALRGLPRAKVLATVVRLLEVTLLRVGNEEYVRQNRSFGLTTLRDRHAKIRGESFKLSFRGKAGKRHEVGLRDRRLARIVRQCQEVPGQHLFQYVDEEGRPQAVSSEDVNDYLRDAMGAEFSAKDFRTWAGTVLAAQALQALREATEDATRNPLVQAVEDVARRLGNTPAICRRCYIHPAIIDAHLDGTLLKVLEQRAGEDLKRPATELRPEERTVLRLLRRRLAKERTGASAA